MRRGWGRNPRVLEGCSLLWAPKTLTEPSPDTARSPHAERSRHVNPEAERSPHAERSTHVNP